MYVMVYTTCASRSEAKSIAEVIVREKLAACVNYFPACSVYTWKGKTETADEYVMLCKTKKSSIKKLERKIKELHSYECPAFVVYRMDYASIEYLSWIDENTG